VPLTQVEWLDCRVPARPEEMRYLAGGQNKEMNHEYE
jgi:hypothetical protein